MGGACHSNGMNCVYHQTHPGVIYTDLPISAENSLFQITAYKLDLDVPRYDFKYDVHTLDIAPERL